MTARVYEAFVEFDDNKSYLDKQKKRLQTTPLQLWEGFLTNSLCHALKSLALGLACDLGLCPIMRTERR